MPKALKERTREMIHLVPTGHLLGSAYAAPSSPITCATKRDPRYKLATEVNAHTESLLSFEVSHFFRGFAKGVSRTVSPRFFLKMKRKKTEENGKKRKKTERNGKKRKKTERNGTNGRKRKKNEENGKKTRKKRKKTEENGKKRKKSEATPFRRPLLRNPDF